MESLAKLKTVIKEEGDKLICETHPESCKMRDASYPQFESLVLDFIFEDEDPISVQTAMAQLEQELATIN